jgi:hypothetical protein
VNQETKDCIVVVATLFGLLLVGVAFCCMLYLTSSLCK